MNKSKNWKTTGAGIAAILIAVGSALAAVTDTDPNTNIEVGSLVAAIMAGIGLIFARDASKAEA